ncbi:MAG: DoxX family protein [Bacteroidaceae bacterium]
MKSKKLTHHLLFVLINLCRFLLAFVFIFSGFVKAIDPLGTSYKLTEYLTHFQLLDYLPAQAPLILSITLCVVEFIIGIYFFFGIRRKFTGMITFFFLSVMTLLTLYLAIKDPITDCGCFGEAITLTNWQTFGKNILLLLCLIITNYGRIRTFRIIAEQNQWFISFYSLIFIITFSFYSIHYLPIVDFRPYRIGVNIKESMEIPKNARKPQYKTLFLFEKEGKRKEFSLENYPDSTWTYVDSHTITLKEGYEPPIKDFCVTDSNGEDITKQILQDTCYQFVLISPHLSNADDGTIDVINGIYDYCSDEGYKFICITAASSSEITAWKDKTGGEYPIFFADDVLLRTIVRSNPGLVLLKAGTIVAKWSCNDLPDDQNLKGKLENLSISTISPEKSSIGLLKVLLLYLLPLLFFTLADRIWIGHKYYKQYKVKSLINKSKEK